jgi:hypothetical protein
MKLFYDQRVCARPPRDRARPPPAGDILRSRAIAENRRSSARGKIGAEAAARTGPR